MLKRQGLKDCDEAHLRTALAGGGIVTFTCSGTITLTAANGGAIAILSDTTIDGTGQKVTISGGKAAGVFSVGSAVPPVTVIVSLNNLTSAEGIAGGGANFNSLLSVTNSTFTGNGAPFGGGINNEEASCDETRATKSFPPFIKQNRKGGAP